VSSRLFHEGVDVFEKLDDFGHVGCYYANTQIRVGFPVAPRIKAYNDALLAGQTACFLASRPGCTTRSDAMADTIVTNRSICKITVRLNVTSVAKLWWWEIVKIASKSSGLTAQEFFL
jgi:hypothetical protein